VLRIILLMCILLFNCIAYAQNKPVHTSLTKCRLLDDNQKRLACYDNIGKSTDKVESIDNKTVISEMPVLIADLEEPRVFVTYGQMDFLDKDFNAVLLGVGTRTKLKTVDIPKINQSVDFNVIGFIKSQFDVSELNTRNNRGGALINTDFMIGGELVKNFRQGSLRLKYTHQSYHLGDEFLIDNPIYLENRLNLSYEALDLLAYRNMNNWGAYLGGSFIVRSEPGNIDKFKVQTGFQYLGHKRDWFAPLFGVDLKSWGETDWHVNASIKAGFEIYGYLDQPVQLMLEYYDGKSPYGQFINDDFSFIGLSVNHYW
jgi:hypothetical protein